MPWFIDKITVHIQQDFIGGFFLWSSSLFQVHSRRAGKKPLLDVGIPVASIDISSFLAATEAKRKNKKRPRELSGNRTRKRLSNANISSSSDDSRTSSLDLPDTEMYFARPGSAVVQNWSSSSSEESVIPADTSNSDDAQTSDSLPSSERSSSSDGPQTPDNLPVPETGSVSCSIFKPSTLPKVVVEEDHTVVNTCVFSDFSGPDEVFEHESNRVEEDLQTLTDGERKNLSSSGILRSLRLSENGDKGDIFQQGQNNNFEPRYAIINVFNHAQMSAWVDEVFAWHFTRSWIHKKVYKILDTAYTWLVFVLGISDSKEGMQAVLSLVGRKITVHLVTYGRNNGRPTSTYTCHLSSC